MSEEGTENEEYPYSKPKKQPEPLTRSDVYEAVRDGTRFSLKLQDETNIPIITGETAAIWREINAIRRLAYEAYWWLVVGVIALVAIAAKLWLF